MPFNAMTPTVNQPSRLTSNPAAFAVSRAGPFKCRYTKTFDPASGSSGAGKTRCSVAASTPSASSARAVPGSTVRFKNVRASNAAKPAAKTRIAKPIPLLVNRVMSPTIITRFLPISASR